VSKTVETTTLYTMYCKQSCALSWKAYFSSQPERRWHLCGSHWKDFLFESQRVHAEHGMFGLFSIAHPMLKFVDI
jgi:hypothetical protein